MTMEQPDRPPFERVIFVCCNEREPGEAACANRGSVELHKAIKERVKALGLKDRIRVTRSLCLGLCEKGPNIVVMPEGEWYHHVTATDIPTILSKHVEDVNPKT